LLQEVRHPFSLVTKSSAIERDLDLIAPMAADRLAAVYVTVTTLDGEVARKLEPRAAAPHRRLRTIRTLAEHGVPVGVSVAPQIPFVTEDMEQVLEAAWEAGARSAFYTVMRLPWEVAPLFKEWLELHYPQRADRIMARIHEMRGGKDYDADFATRMKGSGLWADLIHQRFEKACEPHRLQPRAHSAGPHRVPAAGRGRAGQPVLADGLDVRAELVGESRQRLRAAAVGDGCVDAVAGELMGDGRADGTGADDRDFHDVPWG
jgi:DNA repair photolyase